MSTHSVFVMMSQTLSRVVLSRRSIAKIKGLLMMHHAVTAARSTQHAACSMQLSFQVEVTGRVVASFTHHQSWFASL